MDVATILELASFVFESIGAFLGGIVEFLP